MILTLTSFVILIINQLDESFVKVKLKLKIKHYVIKSNIKVMV